MEQGPGASQVSRDSFCSFGTRSYTFPTSNHVHLAGFDIERDLRAFISGTLGPDLLLPFIHEVTHRSCFRRRVGTALAVMGTRIRLDEVQALLAGRPGADSTRDFIRYSVALSYLRPLAEGIAMFAELHATPGESSADVEAISWAKPLFLRPILHTSPEDADRETQKALGAARLAARALREQLFSDPLNGSRGGYLPGYLAVRKMWQFAVSHAPLFRDTSVFSAFLVEWFFGDPAVAAKLLADDGESAELVEWLDVVVSEKLRIFSDQDLPTRATAIQSALARGARDSLARVHGVDGRSRIDAATDVLQDAFRRLQETELGVIASAILARRELLWLGDIAAQRSAQGVNVALRGGAPLELPLSSDAGRTGDLRLGAFIAPDFTFAGLAISDSAGSCLQFYPTVGRETPALADRYRDAMTQSATVRAMDAMLLQLCAPPAGAGGSTGSAKATTNAQARGATTLRDYWLRSFPGIAPGTVPSLERAGLAAVFGGATAELSLLSACNSFTDDASYAARWCTALGFNYTQAFARVEAASARAFGKPFVVAAGGMFACIV